MKEILLFGDGGHAQVVKEAIEANPGYKLVAVADQKYKKQKIYSNNIIYMSMEEALQNHNKYNCFIAIGDNYIRAQIAEELKKRNATVCNIIHPTAIISSTAKISKGVFISARSLIQANTCIDEYVIVNSGSIVEHDCKIKRFSHLGPGAICTGNVIIEEKVFLGAGAIIIPGKRIEKKAIVGAGATVTSNIKKELTVVGTPAKSIIERMKSK